MIPIARSSVRALLLARRLVELLLQSLRERARGGRGLPVREQQRRARVLRQTARQEVARGSGVERVPDARSGREFPAERATAPCEKPGQLRSSQQARDVAREGRELTAA